MTIFATILYYLLRLLWLFLLVRIVVEMIFSFGRSWRPGPKLSSVLEVVFRCTDWSLKPIRKVLRPVGIGGVGIDFSPLLVFFLISILIRVTLSLGARPLTFGMLM